MTTASGQPLTKGATVAGTCSREEEQRAWSAREFVAGGLVLTETGLTPAPTGRTRLTPQGGLRRVSARNRCLRGIPTGTGLRLRTRPLHTLHTHELNPR